MTMRSRAVTLLSLLLTASVVMYAGTEANASSVKVDEQVIATGTVTDTVTGRPVENAFVTAWWRDPMSDSWRAVGSATTDAEGLYILADAAGRGAGEYQIGAVATGYLDEIQYVEWDAGEPLRVDLSLEAISAVVSVEGDDRYATAVDASYYSNPYGAQTVVIATGRNWPDAIGGSALAGVLDAPILLVTRYAVPEVTAERISALGAGSAVILGGERAVGEEVRSVLLDMGLSVTRIAGVDRYETAAKVAARVIEERGQDYDGVAFLATGEAFADALAAGPLASSQMWPVFLVHPSRGPGAVTVEAMECVESALVLGGESAVSADTYAGLVDRLGEDAVRRLVGQNRYGTATAVAEYGVEHVGFSWNGVGFATGEAYPDALAGGVAQGTMRRALLLTRTHTLPVETEAALEDNRGSISVVTYFGGELAVSAAVRAEVAQVLQ